MAKVVDAMRRVPTRPRNEVGLAFLHEDLNQPGCTQGAGSKGRDREASLNAMAHVLMPLSSPAGAYEIAPTRHTRFAKSLLRHPEVWP